MSLESFYGGKQGVSPVIKAKFKYVNKDDPAYKERYHKDDNGNPISKTTNLTKEEFIYLKSWKVEPYFSTISYDNLQNKEITWNSELLKPFTMDECLKDVNYTDVWYGELCIIDTDSKMNPNNGKIYRRTLKQVDNRLVNTNDTLYAEYIGQIVGPTGGTPHIDFGSLDVERKKAVGIEKSYPDDILDLPNENWEYEYPKDNSGTITRDNPGHDYEKIAVLNAGLPDINGTNVANIQMVSGKTHNTIKYTWCNVRRKEDGKNDDAWVYLGFEIPYAVYETESKTIPYWLNADSVGYSIDDYDPARPFYHNLHFYIPRGTRGIGPEEIGVVGKGFTLPAGTVLYSLGDIEYDSTTDNYSLSTNPITVNPTSTSCWVAKWTLYNPKLVEYNEENHNYEDPGEDISNYQTVYIYLGNYRDVEGIQLLNTGELQIKYSDNNTVWETLNTLTWITSATASLDTTDDNDGNYGEFKLNINFNNNNINPISIIENLHLIKNVAYDDSEGNFTFTYSDMDDIITGDIVYPKQININTDKTSNDYGKVTVYENIDFNKNGTQKADATSTFITTLPLIKNSTYDESSGIITFNYSGDVTSEAGPLKYIQKMRILNDGSIQYQYNTESGDTWHSVTNGTNNNPIKINDILKTEIRENGHLYIQYRVPETNGSDTNGWKDLGLVKGNVTAGPVYTLKNSDDNPTFNDEGTALNILKTKTFDENADTSIGGDGNGHITVNGTDKTGGFIVAQIQKSINSDPYSALFYYDNELEEWVYAGSIGDTGENKGSNVSIESFNGESSLPEENDFNPKFIFKDGNVDLPINYSAEYEGTSYGQYDYNNEPVIGFMPWQNNKVQVIGMA